MKQVLANALVAGSIYSLVAIGFSFVWSVTRFFHFAHGAIYSLSAYATYVAVKFLHMPLAIGVVIGILVGATSGAATEFAVYRRLRKRHATPVVLLLSSLGLLIVIQNFISLFFGDQPRVLRTGGVSEGVAFVSVRLTTFQIVILLTNVLLTGFVWFGLQRTQLGKVIRAVASDPDLGNICGIAVDRTIMLVFAVGSAIAAIGAIAVGLDTDLTPAMGFNALLMGAAAAIIGGFGSVAGAFTGGLLVGFVQHFGVWKLPTEWQDAIVFIVVLLFLILRPQGFFGKPLRSAHA